MATTNLTLSMHTVVDADGEKATRGDKFTIYIECGGVNLHTFALFGDESHAKKTISRIKAAIASGKVTISKR